MYLQSSEGYAWYIPRTRPLCQLFSILFQPPEQPEEGAVWEVVEDDSETDDEDLGVVRAEDDLVEDPESEALHRLPCLSPLSNVHDDVSPW
jgi:hypothetical protein